MKISRISQFFSTGLSTGAANQSEQADSSEKVQSSSQNQSSGAVRFGQGFQSEASQTDRQAKIAALKSQIQDGSYRVGSRELAGSVYKELFL